MAGRIGGYAGKVLRVDLTNERVSAEEWDEATLRAHLGGTGLGAKVLYDEVPPGVAWNDPGNRLVIASGPLGGTRVVGSGTISIITKGPLTNGATSTQANGMMGAYMKFSGFDAVIVQGAASRWLYLYMHDGTAELRGAAELVGKDTWETDDAIKETLGKREQELSVFCIGPAGENLVKLAAICGDKGHVAGHNGVGAVMGSKKLKAIVASRGRARVEVKDGPRLLSLANEVFEKIKSDPQAGQTYRWGTLFGIVRAAPGGWLPIKNYTTNIYPIEPERLAKYGGDYIRGHFEPRRHPCWACRMHHCHIMRITEGPYTGEVVEEPEYEGFAAWGPVTGQTEVASTMVISNDVDRLGMDTNECGWLFGLVIECYEKGILTKSDTDGLEMTWGNADAVRAMLRKVARREGFGDIMAEGTMRAAQRIGGEAVNMAIHTMKGNSPRGHDHRSIWSEMFDTCVSSTGTIETVRSMQPHEMARLGLPAQSDPFSPMDVSTSNARTKGCMQFEDSLGTCRFTSRTDMDFLTQMVEAATGWDMTFDEAMALGRRAVNRLRAFNLRHGITADLDAPSPRYGSTPVDGPTAGKSIQRHWKDMVRNYYRNMGWDEESGKPLPETLRALGLESVIPDLWPK